MLTNFGEKTSVSAMRAEDLEQVLAFEEEWLSENSETHDAADLLREKRCIERQLAHFEELRLTGTVIRVEDKVQAFCYGAPRKAENSNILRTVRK